MIKKIQPFLLRSVRVAMGLSHVFHMVGIFGMYLRVAVVAGSGGVCKKAVVRPFLPCLISRPLLPSSTGLLLSMHRSCGFRALRFV